ncbi:MAG: outer membrane beta-barrel protein [Syntrophales bacterium]|nr:outer membrane beta-barrel protein [Syntrophales bacterium]
MKTVLAVVCLVLFAVLFSSISLRAASDGQSYVILKGGIYEPQGDLKDLDTGFNGEIAIGRKINPSFAVEFGSGYMETSKTIRESVGVYSVSEDVKVYAIPITVAVKGIVPIAKKAELYGIAGAGVYYVHGSVTYTIPGYGRASGSDNSFVVGGFLGAGGVYNITPNWFLGLEGKYLWTGETTLRAEIAGIPVGSDFSVEGVKASAVFGYRF